VQSQKDQRETSNVNVGELAAAAISFGPYTVYVDQRRLEKSGQPVDIGGRAFDLLTTLLERPGEVVSQAELLDRVWPRLMVEESSLRAQVRTLRRVLDDHDDGSAQRLIVNVPGRGYCFTGTARTMPAVPRALYRLPPSLERMLDRQRAVDEISALLMERRFVTVVGTGGIGKTTVGLAVVRDRLTYFAGAVGFVDVSHLSDEQLVTGAVISALELHIYDDDPLPALISALGARPVLLVFDSCEHLIDAVAVLAERLHLEASLTYIMATSREPLRVRGENVYLLDPLETPPPEAELSIENASTFSAMELFLERLAAAGRSPCLSVRELEMAADICRKLDGLPLAIEFAAGRVLAYGVEGVAAHLEQRFQFLTSGLRTAPPRHRTLQATLDWSYTLLSESERKTLRRLSCLVGEFTDAAACAIAAGDGVEEDEALEALAGLVSKSLISVKDRPERRYVLLDTTRAYAQEKLVASGEASRVARRHAEYFRDLLQAGRSDQTVLGRGSPTALHGHLGNIRAALQWSFSAKAEVALATELALGFAPVFLDLSLFSECERWTGQAMAVHDETPLEAKRLFDLLTFNIQAAALIDHEDFGEKEKFLRAARLAETLGDADAEIRILIGLHRFYACNESVSDSLVVAERMRTIANNANQDSETPALASFAASISHHCLGNQIEACRLHEAGVRSSITDDQRKSMLSLISDLRASIVHCRALWLRGLPDKALSAAEQTFAIAETIKSKGGARVLLYIWFVQLFIWLQDWARAEAIANTIAKLTRARSSVATCALGLAVQGELLVRKGDTVAGVSMLRNQLELIRSTGCYTTGCFTAMPTLAYVEGLMALSDFDPASRVLEDAISRSKRDDFLMYMPEMLRLRGDLAALQDRTSKRAESWFRQSIALARQQFSLSWELRTATSLARLLQAQGRSTEAQETVREVYDRFTEGFDTADLRTARSLIHTHGA
jgi:predicted ATPase/DNA-binding winged helix-turn-helix (wHTH) protein